MEATENDTIRSLVGCSLTEANNEPLGKFGPTFHSHGSGRKKQPARRQWRRDGETVRDFRSGLENMAQSDAPELMA